MGKRNKAEIPAKTRGSSSRNDRLGKFTRTSRTQSQNDGDAEEQEHSGSVYIATAITLLVLSVYIRTLHPSVPGGDSGELIVTAHEFGVAHPPGYPLFTLAGKLSLLTIPFGSPAWRMHILNASFSSISVGTLFYVVHRLTGNIFGGLLACSLFAFSKLAWYWAVSAEVFGLNNLFVSVIMLLVVHFQSQKEDEQILKWAKYGAFVCGLSLCNQHTVIIYVAVVAMWVLYRLHLHQLLSLQSVIHVGFYGTLGLLPYIYLPISSFLNIARWTWGDQTSLSGFLTHLLRSEYGTFDLGKDSKGLGFAFGLYAYIQHVSSDLLMVGAGLATLGVIDAIIRKRTKDQDAALVFTVMLVVYVCFFAWRANLDISQALFRGVVERFWLQSDLVVAALAGLGYDACIRWLKTKIASKGSHGPSVVAVIGCIFVLSAQLKHNFYACDQSSNVVVRDFAKTLLGNMPRNALVLTKGDLPTNSLRYLHLVENIRPDLYVFDQEILSYQWSLPMIRKFFPKINFPGDYWHLTNHKHPDGIRSFTFKTFLDSNYEKFPIFVCIGMQDHDPSWQESYQLWPYGVCSQVMHRSEKIDAKGWAEYTKSLTDSWNYPLEVFDDVSWEKVANDEMWHAKISTPFFMYKQATTADDPAFQTELYVQSYKLYDQAIKKNKGYPIYWHKNIALSYEKLLNLEHNINKTELCAQSLYHFQKYQNISSIDPDAANIKNAIGLLKKRLVMYQQLEKLDNVGKS